MFTASIHRLNAKSVVSLCAWIRIRSLLDRRKLPEIDIMHISLAVDALPGGHSGRDKARSTMWFVADLEK